MTEGFDANSEICNKNDNSCSIFDLNNGLSKEKTIESSNTVQLIIGDRGKIECNDKNMFKEIHKVDDSENSPLKHDNSSKIKRLKNSFYCDSSSNEFLTDECENIKYQKVKNKNHRYRNKKQIEKFKGPKKRKKIKQFTVSMKGNKKRLRREENLFDAEKHTKIEVLISSEDKSLVNDKVRSHSYNSHSSNIKKGSTCKITIKQEIMTGDTLNFIEYEEHKTDDECSESFEIIEGECDDGQMAKHELEYSQDESKEEEDGHHDFKEEDEESEDISSDDILLKRKLQLRAEDVFSNTCDNKINTKWVHFYTLYTFAAHHFLL